jgi:hypothetical protein
MNLHKTFSRSLERLVADQTHYSSAGGKSLAVKKAPLTLILLDFRPRAAQFIFAPAGTCGLRAVSLHFPEWTAFINT